MATETCLTHVRLAQNDVLVTFIKVWLIYSDYFIEFQWLLCNNLNYAYGYAYGCYGKISKAYTSPAGGTLLLGQLGLTQNCI